VPRFDIQIRIALAAPEAHVRDGSNFEEKTMKHLAAAFLGICAFLAANAGPSGYSLVGRTNLPGAGGWDYVAVDEVGRRVYVSHSTQVEVLDADSQKSVGTISDTPGVHGIAIVRDAGRGFITAGRADAVVVFDLDTLKQIGQVKVGKKPDAIVFDPATNRVFAMNGSSNSTSAIDVSQLSVAGTIDLGGGPESAVADGKGNIWVNLEDKSELVRIDSKALKILNRWPTAPCGSPSSMALDAANRRLFLGCRNHIMAVANADTGSIVANYPIGDHVDSSWFDPATKLIFNSLGEGSIAVFRQDSADHYTFVENIPTAPSSKTMALDSQTDRLFVPALQDGQFSVMVFDRAK
jgi:YVTN family beta-propeller protein